MITEIGRCLDGTRLCTGERRTQYPAARDRDLMAVLLLQARIGSPYR